METVFNYIKEALVNHKVKSKNHMFNKNDLNKIKQNQFQYKGISIIEFRENTIDKIIKEFGEDIFYESIENICYVIDELNLEDYLCQIVYNEERLCFGFGINKWNDYKTASQHKFNLIYDGKTWFTIKYRFSEEKLYFPQDIDKFKIKYELT